MKGIALWSLPFWHQVSSGLFSKWHVYSLPYSGNGSFDAPCNLSKIPITYYKTASLDGLAEITTYLRFPRSCNNVRGAGKASII